MVHSNQLKNGKPNFVQKYTHLKLTHLNDVSRVGPNLGFPGKVSMIDQDKYQQTDKAKKANEFAVDLIPIDAVRRGILRSITYESKTIYLDDIHDSIDS